LKAHKASIEAQAIVAAAVIKLNGGSNKEAGVVAYEIVKKVTRNLKDARALAGKALALASSLDSIGYVHMHPLAIANAAAEAALAVNAEPIEATVIA